MKIYQKKWWKKAFDKRSQPKQNSVKDIEAIIEFLENINHDAKALLKHFKKLHELEKERKVAKGGIVHVNVDAQSEIMEDLLQDYQFLQNDVDINGIRVKRIATHLLINAKDLGMKDLVKEKQQSSKWDLNW